VTSVVFLGTPSSAVPTLRALAAAFEIRGVVIQPDRPRGRSAEPQAPDVKVAAQELGIQTYQPETAGDLEASISGLRPFSVGVVVAFGRLLTPSMLAAPDRGMLNLHFSLLPRWRGAAPVARALMEGDRMTGVTIIQLDEGLDTGPVVTAQAIDIRRDENAGQLTARLARVGASLMTAVLPEYVAGSLQPVEQSDDGLAYAAKLSSADRLLTSEMGPESFVNHVRGLAPVPGGVISVDGVAHKVLAAKHTPDALPRGQWANRGGRLIFGVRDGSVEVTEIQPPGKRVMAAGDWLRGRRAEAGSIG